MCSNAGSQLEKYMELNLSSAGGHDVKLTKKKVSKATNA